MIMEGKFEYGKALEELEAIAAKVEDPATGLDEVEKLVERSRELTGECRAYLRGVQLKVESIASEDGSQDLGNRRNK
jgi:exodeoxyribonuclease VII small subunit